MKDGGGENCQPNLNKLQNAQAALGGNCNYTPQRGSHAETEIAQRSAAGYPPRARDVLQTDLLRTYYSPGLCALLCALVSRDPNRRPSHAFGAFFVGRRFRLHALPLR